MILIAPDGDNITNMAAVQRYRSAGVSPVRREFGSDYRC